MDNSPQFRNLKRCLDELLQAHNDFDAALWTADHDGMMKAQKRIETARCKASVASSAIDSVLGDTARLDSLLEIEDKQEIERNTRL